MQDTELRLSDLLVLLLRKWRSMICVGLVVGILLGASAVALRVISLNDPEQLAHLQAEYEVAYNQYWNAIEATDRQIRNNENYVSQAEEDLADLVRRKENYQHDIEDLEADIEYNNLQILDMEKNIEVLEIEKENAQYRLNYRNEQNANSLYMLIDPYDVKISEIFIRVDSGYQIIPGSTYQDTDPTDELLQTYRLLVGNAEFYEKMIADLGLNTEVRYLTELLSIVEYNDTTLRIRVISHDADVSLKIANYLRDAIFGNYELVVNSVSDHTIEEYSSRNYAIVDIDVYNAQQDKLMAATDLEAQIRDLDAKILNIESAIRANYADVRDLEDRIQDLKTAIANIPVREESLNSAISNYEDTINQLRLQRLDLLKEKEPSEPGMTVKGGIFRFAKFAIIGGVVGVVLAAAWIVLRGIFSGKLMSAKHATDMLGVGYFGTWPEVHPDKKNLFARLCGAVDGLVDRLVGTRNGDALLVCANIAAAAGDSSVLICGGASLEKIQTIAEEMNKKYSAVKITAAGSVAEDPNAVNALAACDAVILVEQVYGSDMCALEQTWDRAKALDKQILGVVIA